MGPLVCTLELGIYDVTIFVSLSHTVLLIDFTITILEYSHFNKDELVEKEDGWECKLCFKVYKKNL